MNKVEKTYIISFSLLNIYNTCDSIMITNIISKNHLQRDNSHGTDNGIENSNERIFSFNKSIYPDFQKTIGKWEWTWWMMKVQSDYYYDIEIIHFKQWFAIFTVLFFIIVIFFFTQLLIAIQNGVNIWHRRRKIKIYICRKLITIYTFSAVSIIYLQE